MCPMCERRAQLLLQQQQQQEYHAVAVESSLGTSPASSKPARVPPSNIKASLFRNPFKSCKNFAHQCCSPVCESQRTSLHSVRRSSVRPSFTPDHTGEITYVPDDYRVFESSFRAKPFLKEYQQLVVKKVPPNPVPNPNAGRVARKSRGLLTRLKLLTQGSASQSWQGDVDISSADSSFTSSGRKAIAVVDRPEHAVIPSPTLVALETSLDSTSETSLNLTETNVSETTMISMRNLNGSLSSPSFRSTLKSSAYDDDASTFAIIPRTSVNSQDWTSDSTEYSDRFGELDIGYLSLEESGEGPDIDDTASILSSQYVDLDPTDTVSESDLDQDYSIGTDSQEWFTKPDNTASVLQWSRGHISKNHLHLHLPDLETTPPHQLTASSHSLTSLPRHNSLTEEHLPQDLDQELPLDVVTAPTLEVMEPDERKHSSEYLCSRCGRKDKKHSEGQTTKKQSEAQTTKKLTRKQNPMAAYFSTVMDGEDQAVIAAKVVVLLGKYGNKRGLRVAGLPPLKGSPMEVDRPSKELARLRNMLSPSNNAVSAFQNEVARMMLEGVDGPALDQDVEQFLAGYMKLNSPFYIDLIEDFFKSVCVDCFGHMEEVQGRRSSASQRPAYTVLKPKKPSPRSSTGKR